MITIPKGHTQTDGRTIYNRNTTLCTKVHRAVKIVTVFTARCTLVQSAVLRLCILSVRPSVCPSVTFRYRDHTGWNSWKIISRPNRLRPLLGLTPTWAIWCNGNTPNFWKYKVHADIHGGSPVREHQTTLGVVDNSNFWRFRWLL